jgi:hypothetical protein
MTRDWSKIFLGFLVACFCAEHIYFASLNMRDAKVIDSAVCTVRIVK